jgi:hypothetical protein
MMQDKDPNLTIKYCGRIIIKLSIVVIRYTIHD